MRSSCSLVSLAVALLVSGCSSGGPSAPAELPPGSDAPAAAGGCCAAEAGAEPAAPTPSKGSCCQAPPAGEHASASLPDTSVYQLASSWADAAGATRRLEELRGRVVVAAMIFTHCTYACPLTLGDLRVIDDALGAQAAEVRYLLVSLDHERDLPPALEAYAQRNALDSRWTLLHGGADEVRELAATLNVRYQRAPSGDYAHSNLIHVLDPDGVVVHQQEGLGADPTATVAAIRRVLAAPTAAK